MRLRTHRIFYIIQGPDGCYIGKNTICFYWTDDLSKANVWVNITRISRDLSQGKLDTLLDGLPISACKVIQYEMRAHRTGKKHRLSELDRFAKEETPKEENEDGGKRV